MNILKHQEVCEDIIQNVFIQLWEKRRDNKITHLKPYLYQSVKFQVFKSFRNQHFKQEDLTRLNLVDASLNASRQIEFDELESLINSLVEKLTPKCREIFIMSRFEEKSNKQIAEELGMSIQTVKNQVSKAIKKLREQMMQEQIVIYPIIIFMLSLY